MKGVTTNKTLSFETWRQTNVNRFGDFVWLQMNYDSNNADIISVIFEEKLNINSNLTQILNKIHNIPYFILNFTDISSTYYTDGVKLHDKLGLVLGNALSRKINSYWDYRLATRPQNCLSADIDSLEIAKTQLVAIEAAQLFNTNTIDEAIPHIFRTFKFRKNEVNEKQYLAQYKLMQKLDGKAFILFHIITNNALNDTTPVFLIKNDINFYDMLCEIKDLSRNDEAKFIMLYQNYLTTNLKPYKDIYSAYNYIKQL